MLTHAALVFLAGLVLILVGAEMTLRGATRIAGLMRIPPIVIGLTVVSVGTSTPELAVGVTAAHEGRDALAVGNIAGTNIVNILLILGLSAAIRALPLHLLSIRLDLPAMVATALALIALSADGVLSHVDGAAMLVAAVVYTVVLVRASRRESVETRREFAAELGAVAGEAASAVSRPGLVAARSGTMLLAGIVATVVGADWLVSGAATIARLYGVSDALIGLTIVAIGTSAPEIATTLVATLRDDRDVAVGNLIGSSIYNVLVILALTCVISPDGLDVGRDLLLIDLPLAAAVALLCVPVFRSGGRVSRTEGALFVAAYVAYFVGLLALRG